VRLTFNAGGLWCRRCASAPAGAALPAAAAAARVRAGRVRAQGAVGAQGVGGVQPVLACGARLAAPGASPASRSEPSCACTPCVVLSGGTALRVVPRVRGARTTLNPDSYWRGFCVLRAECCPPWTTFTPQCSRGPHSTGRQTRPRLTWCLLARTRRHARCCLTPPASRGCALSRPLARPHCLLKTPATHYSAKAQVLCASENASVDTHNFAESIPSGSSSRCSDGCQ
jgi:hypothetical protein